MTDQSTTDRTALPVTVWNTVTIRIANQMGGFHFFDVDTMRFFNSRILPTVHQGRYGVYFVTSERFDENTPRRYTVRRFDPATGKVDTVGNFQGHRRAIVARSVAWHCAKYPAVESR